MAKKTMKNTLTNLALTISPQQKIRDQKRLCRITTLINNIQSAPCKSLSLLGLVIPSPPCVSVGLVTCRRSRNNFSMNF